MVCNFFMPCSVRGSAFLPEIRVVVLGDAKVGKTALLRQYLHHESPSPSASNGSTLLDSYTHVEHCGKQSYRLIFTDCSSAPSFREHRAAYLAKCDVVILVYSALHRKTLLNLRHWVREMMEARGSAGPARMDSETGDFGRVPIFVIGTHYGEKDALEATDPTSTVEAESITKECLQSAGYLIDEEDAKAKEELGAGAARAQMAQQHPQRQETKLKRTLSTLSLFFHKVFLSGAEGEGNYASAKKKGTSEGVAAHQRHQPASSVHGSRCLSPATSAPVLAQLKADVPNDNTKLSGTMSSLSIPPGASARLPLFQLSNTDIEAVNMALRASLLLYLWLQRQACRDAALSRTHASRNSSAIGSKPANAVAQSAPLEANSNSAGGAPAAATESTAKGLRILPAALHACTISNALHTSRLSERSGGSFMPPMLALYSAGLSASIGGGSTDSLRFRNSCGVSYVGEMAGSSSVADQQARQAPGTAQPPQESVCLCGADGGTEVAIDGEAEVKAVSEKACHSVCSGAFARRTDGPEDESLWCTPASFSSHGESKKEDSTNCGSLQAVLSRGPDLASSSKSGRASASGASTEMGKPVPLHASSSFPPPNPRWATVPNTGSRETSGDVSKAVDVSTTSILRDAAYTAGSGFSALSDPMTKEHASFLPAATNAAERASREPVEGDIIGAVPLPPASQVRGEVGIVKEGDSTGFDSCDDRQTKKGFMARKLSLKRVPNGSLSSSPMPQRNRDNGCAESSAVHLPSANPLASLGLQANVYGNASWTARLSQRNGSVSHQRSLHASTSKTTAVTNNEITSTKPPQQSARARQAATLPLLPSCMTAARQHETPQSHPLPLKQGGKERPTGLRAFKQSGTSVTSPRTLVRQQQQKESVSHCHTGGCTVM
ncbi:hypothetical protein GH5_00189 [Leishmania sp. Ghana 2012 LV757]|uniref:hypothetical protein n=1 Tax=Leishmania sp. Ghana 2012 LV757 TaxID=2803181 RepID=UPI001B6737A3|nr:hypothetical protein GH5_00189 [Leishmania sp. Ghana 2012 LV757]